MKKILGITALVLCLLANCFASFAAERSDYTIYYVDFWIDEGNGDATVEWQLAEKKTSYTIELRRTSHKNGIEKTVFTKQVGASTDKIDVTTAIRDNGTGIYRAIVIPDKDKMEFMPSDSITVDEGLLKIIKRHHSGGSGGGSGSGSTSGWFQDFDGKWYYIKSNGTFAANGWELINGKWYLFNGNGMMLTGWQWVRGSDGWRRCYYLDPNGACQLGGVTPDGYTVDASGAWTVNGIVQMIQ